MSRGPFTDAVVCITGASSGRTIFERVMRVNFLGSVWCTSYALPHLERTRGRSVAVSSLAGLPGVPRRTADECCRLILHAAARRGRDIIMTWRAKFGRALKLISSALVDRFAKRAIEGKQ